MADVKWIKLSTDIFSNRKIRQIECLPDGHAIIVAWVKLLCLAGNINDSGLIYFTKEIPYNDQMLATHFNMPLATVQLALRTFEQFGMVEVIDNILHISNWEKYQSADKLLEIREYNRLAQQKSRAKKKLEQQKKGNVNDMSMTCQPCQGTEVEEDKEEEKDKDKEKNIKVVEVVESAATTTENDISLILQTWEKCTSSKLTAKIKEDLKILAEKHGSEKVTEAIHIASDRGKVNLGYVKGILKKPDNPKSKQGSSNYEALMDYRFDESALDKLKQYYGG